MQHEELATGILGVGYNTVAFKLSAHVTIQRAHMLTNAAQRCFHVEFYVSKSASQQNARNYQVIVWVMDASEAHQH
ncbi:unnamed protein product [Ceratitis capitata]|uniref:(Mediterranean fruit fly) hypothetical protein n=1 Tax=Ceratitis capitata TaxID=7213 RepID=A0A811UHG4_CERCA|nr:unnamed protein product [Ceratitis capitata]